MRPALSPDGKTLVFISRRDDDTVMVARDLASGSERILARARDARRGRGLRADGPLAQLRLHARRQVARLLEREQARRAWTSRAAPSRTIPFTAAVEQFVAPRVTWQEKVESGPVKARILRWPSQSADGKTIAFEAFGRVWLQEISGGKTVGSPRRLTKDDAALPHREYAPAFSPDGKSIVYVSWSDAEGGHVWKAAAVPGAAPVKLTRHPGHYVNPAWSPKGDHIALLRGSGLEFRGQQPEEEDFFELGVLDAAGGEIRPVTTIKLGEGLHFHPQAFWNADGTRIYYRDPVEAKKPTDDPKNDLVSVRPDGTDKKTYLRFPAVDDLVPSPDEQWIVFTSRDNVYVTAFPGVLTKEPPEVGLKEGAVPVYRLSDDAGGYVRWADGGRTITWALANTFYRLPLASAVDFARDRAAQGRGEGQEGGREEGRARHREGKSRQGEGEGPGGARPEVRDDRDRADGAAARAGGLVPAARRARHPDEGRRRPRERRHPRHGQPHRGRRPHRVAEGAGGREGATTAPARP